MCRGVGPHKVTGPFICKNKSVPVNNLLCERRVRWLLCNGDYRLPKCFMKVLGDSENDLNGSVI